MKLIRRISTEPNGTLGVVTAALGLAILFGVPLSEVQTGGIVAFVGALLVWSRQLTAPYSEVVVQEKPDGQLVAGPAAGVAKGTVLSAVRTFE